MTDDIDIAQLRSLVASIPPANDPTPVDIIVRHLSATLDALEQARKERDEALDERMRSERDHYRESYHRELGRANRYLAQTKADQAERDAMRQQLDECRAYRDAYRKDAEHLHNEDRPVRRELRLLKVEHAELRQQLETVTRERDEARAAGAWKPSEVWRKEAADETAAAIAAWLDEWEPEYMLRRNWGVQSPGEDMTVAHTLEMAAQQLRAGSWRAKEGK